MPDGVAVYPGTFDPVTRGHLDIVARAVRLFGRVIVAVAEATSKTPLLPLDRRVDLVRAETAGFGPAVEVCALTGLLATFARGRGAVALVRGLRGVADFDFEQQMAGINRRLAPEIDTVFLMASAETRDVSSTFVREVARAGGDVSGMVGGVTARALGGK